MFLLDTNVISATSPVSRERTPEMERWLIAASDYLYLSVITISEVQTGIVKARREGADRRADNLQTWWDTIEALYAHRILPIDAQTARTAGDIADYARGHDPGYEDIAIAATAKVHGLTVLTRNVRHISPFGIPVFDPFRELPDLPAK